MVIVSYSFGAMEIDGHLYTSDLIILPDGTINADWWRAEGHRLTREDISTLIVAKPEIIVAGTGKVGLMKPEPALESYLKEKGIQLEVMPTAEAVKRFNELARDHQVGGCFHLTC
ncbi:Mth938-like domain-containing protein [Verrucomicrobiota bacterium]